MAEEFDQDRTVFMPTPGGRMATPPARPVPVEQEQLDGRVVPSGLNPLVAAANSLLDVIPQLRGSIQHPNPNGLRDSLAQSIREFEARARAAGAPTEKVIAARYAICTLVDETAANTPWGVSGAWAQHGLLALFHGETGGGEKFFQLLARLAENPQANLDVIELMYVCLQLGFEGRYRIVEGGQRQLETVRRRVLAIIRKERGEFDRDLSPSWQGAGKIVEARLSWLPVWVIAAVVAVILVGVYIAYVLSLSGASDRIAADVAGLRVAAAPPVPAAPKRVVEPRLAGFLAEEIRRGLVAVEDRADRSIVTILGDGIFKPGEVVARSEDVWLFNRIGDALLSVPGQVEVIGYTDNQPIRTLRFPSNWELSKARADTVAKLLTVRVPASRISAEGRGEADPVAPNDTPQGRAKNRRVEITLYVPGGSAPAAAPTPATPPAPAPPEPGPRKKK
jgi:type VI secretion system protein ImpK